MHRFTALYDDLDATTRTSEKQAALERYFREAPAEDAAWALHFLTGRRPRRAVSHTQLRAWAAEVSGTPLWLLDECYDTVGDLSETLALLLPDEGVRGDMSLGRIVEERLIPLSRADEARKRELLLATWSELPSRQRFLFHKLISGSFRVGAARKLVVRALAAVARIDPAIMDHRLLGAWRPTAEDFRRLISPVATDFDPAQPYPFFLASQLDDPPTTETLGEIGDWHAEWKWDGIRAQLIHRAGDIALIWSRGEEIVNESFPELVELARALPIGAILDGEILAWDAREGDRPLPFSTLQLRLNRKNVAPMLFPDVPIIFMAYDILEHEGRDVRDAPFDQRRGILTSLIAPIVSEPSLRVSPAVTADSWPGLAEARAASRARGVEGLMLKRRDSRYGVGRTRGDWWKWKVDPFTIDAVLTHAQQGSGRRASLYTDYTFGVWHEGALVTIAKAYSGLTNEEIGEVDAIIRDSIVARRGPVREVTPMLVFELAFEGIQESSRHKAGLAVRFPRIARWRRDKKPADADTLDMLRALYRSIRR